MLLFFFIVIRILSLLPLFPNFPRPTLSILEISSESINSSKLHLIWFLFKCLLIQKKIMWCKKHKTPTSFQWKIRCTIGRKYPSSWWHVQMYNGVKDSMKSQKDLHMHIFYNYYLRIFLQFNNEKKVSCNRIYEKKKL